MLYNIIFLIIVAPTAIYNLYVGNFWIGALTGVASLYPVYMILTGQSATKAMDFLNVIFGEKAEDPDELMANIMDEMTEDVDLEEKVDDIKEEIPEEKLEGGK